VRVHAYNAGNQGGYGIGDRIEITFNIRTDRAGFQIQQLIMRPDLDRLLVFSPLFAEGHDAYFGVWLSDCTLVVRCGRSGDVAPEIGLFTVRVRDDFYELRDHKQRLRSGSTSVSRPLSGTFGAAQGTAGRVDPLRETLPDLGMRRYIPPLSIDDDRLRVGPLAWHHVVAFNPLAETYECECDEDELSQRVAAKRLLQLDRNGKIL